MPFLRFSRDKRGYEHTYLVHTANRRGKPSRPRILYWYRTPPGVRVGRKPFDEEVRRTIEAQNPGVVFDWESFSKAQIPAAEPEPWWERRRAERAAKQARRADDVVEVDEPSSNAVAAGDDDSAASATEEPAETGSLEPTSEVSGSVPLTTVADGAGGGPHADSGQPAADGQPANRKRRRRGGRRRRGRTGAPGASAQGPDGVPLEPGAIASAPMESDPELDAIPEGDVASEPSDFDPSSPEE